MKLTVSPEIFESFPGVSIGIVRAGGLDNRSGSDSDAEIAARLKRAEDQVKESFRDVVVTEHPHILPWREAYRSFGAKPKKYPSSIESLVRRVSRGESLRSINKLVDLYNVVSLNHLLPVGGEDIDRMEGDLSLRRAGPDELEVRLLGESEPRAPRSGEVIYSDAIGAVCRRWNWKEADRSKLTEQTTEAVLVIERLPPVEQSVLEAALSELAELVGRFTGADVASSILDAATSSIELSSS